MFAFFPLYRSEGESQHELSRLPAWLCMLGSTQNSLAQILQYLNFSFHIAVFSHLFQSACTPEMNHNPI